MQQSLDIMKVYLRVLAAVNARETPSQTDVETLVEYLGRPGSANPDELAYEAIQKALFDPSEGARHSGSRWFFLAPVRVLWRHDPLHH